MSKQVHFSVIIYFFQAPNLRLPTTVIILVPKTKPREPWWYHYDIIGFYSSIAMEQNYVMAGVLLKNQESGSAECWVMS